MHSMVLAPLPKIFGPLIWIGEICRDYSQIFVLRRTHDVHGASALSETEYQAAMAARVIGIVLNDFPAANYGFHFVGTDHAQRARHLPGSREVKTKGAFEPHPAHFRESPSNFLQRFDLIVAYQPLRKNGSHGRAAGYLMFSRRYRVLTF
jgi:hypothetical protein